jgi:hypothetical protein
MFRARSRGNWYITIYVHTLAIFRRKKTVVGVEPMVAKKSKRNVPQNNVTVIHWRSSREKKTVVGVEPMVACLRYSVQWFHDLEHLILVSVVITM